MNDPGMMRAFRYLSCQRGLHIWREYKVEGVCHIGLKSHISRNSKFYPYIQIYICRYMIIYTYAYITCRV